MTEGLGWRQDPEEAEGAESRQVRGQDCCNLGHFGSFHTACRAPGAGCHPQPSKHIFLTAQLQSDEILGSVPDPGAETRPGTLLPATPACCQDPLPLPRPPHSLRVIRFLSISRLRSLPAHLATKLRTHSWRKGGCQEGHMGVMGEHEMLGFSGASGMQGGLRPPKGQREAARNPPLPEQP